MKEVHKHRQFNQAAGLHARSFDFKIDKKGAILFESGSLLEDIPAGIYVPRVRGDYYLQPFDSNVIEEARSKEEPVQDYFPIEKYNPGLQEADKNIHRFVKAKEYYRTNNLPYKRSILIYGDAGTGKSQYIHHISKKLVKEQDAIVIRVLNATMLTSVKNTIMPLLNVLTDRLKVIVIEELFEIRRGTGESEITKFLSHPNYSENVLFLMTTNYPKELSASFVNIPSRIDVLAEVFADQFGADFTDAWYKFIMGKGLSPIQKLEPWYRDVTNNWSPAYLKELFIGSLLHEISIQEYWLSIKNRKEEIHNRFSKKTRIGFTDDEYFDDELSLEDLMELERVLELNCY